MFRRVNHLGTTVHHCLSAGSTGIIGSSSSSSSGSSSIISSTSSSSGGCCRVGVPATGGDSHALGTAALWTARRYNLLEHPTKGSPHMKHLDLYARRDPQLAPYLLREVDIEYKRKCRKVNFLMWTIFFTMAIALQSRIQGESMHHLRNYAALTRAEQEAKDEDNVCRRKAMVEVMGLVVHAFDRDQTWSREDKKRAQQILLSSSSSVSSSSSS